MITATTKDGSKRKASCTVYVLKGGNTSNTTTGSTTESKIESTTGAASQNGESALARKFLALLESIPGRYRVMRPVELQNGFIRILVHRLIGVPL